MDNAVEHLQSFLPWQFDHQHAASSGHHQSRFSFFNLYTTRRLLQIVPSPTPAPSPVNTRNCCCRGTFCCCDAPGAPCCNVLSNGGISTQRYIFGILALLVIVFVVVFYACMACRFMKRRRRAREVEAQAAMEEERRQKELLEMVERACSVPYNVVAYQKSITMSAATQLDTLSTSSSTLAADVVMPSASSAAKLYLSQECPVCLEDVADMQEWRTFRCGHGICYTCLATAVKHASSALDIKCPICREHVLDLPREEAEREDAHAVVEQQQGDEAVSSSVDDSTVAGAADGAAGDGSGGGDGSGSGDGGAPEAESARGAVQTDAAPVTITHPVDAPLPRTVV